MADVELKAAHRHVATNAPTTKSYYRLLNLHKTVL